MVKWGIYYGIASVVVTMLLFLIKKELLFNFGIGLAAGLGLAIIFIVLALKEVRANNEGYLGYGEAVKVGLVTFVIGSLISTIWMYVLYNFIDPSLFEMEKQKGIEAAEKMVSMFSDDEALIEETMAKAREELDAQGDSKSIMSLLGGWGISILFPGLPLALITGAFMKKSS